MDNNETWNNFHCRTQSRLLSFQIASLLLNNHFWFWRSSSDSLSWRASPGFSINTGSLLNCSGIRHSPCVMRDKHQVNWQETSQILGNVNIFIAPFVMSFPLAISIYQPWKSHLTSRMHHLGGFIRLVHSLQVGWFNSSVLSCCLFMLPSVENS